MHYLRFFLIALLTLTLPVSAIAGFEKKGHCIMKASGVVVSLGKKCCDSPCKMQLSTKAHACKMGQKCSSFQGFPPVIASPALSLPTAPAHTHSLLQTAFISHLREVLWRPPRART